MEYYLYVYEHKTVETDLFAHTSHIKSITIKIGDDKLWENFMDELSKTSVENVRGLDYLNYEAKYSNEPYYYISPEYEDSNGKYKRPYDFDKNIFSEMRLNRNGELILVNYNTKRNFLLFLYRNEIYRVNLSQELTNQIIELFENE